jgi:hypothetical protein
MQRCLSSQEDEQFEKKKRYQMNQKKNLITKIDLRQVMENQEVRIRLSQKLMEIQ